MKGKSHQILEFLYKNRNAYTKDEILSNITLEKENDSIVKTLYDMRKKRDFIYLVGTHRYKITDKGMNHAAISYGMSDKDIMVVPTKPAPLKQSIDRTKRDGGLVNKAVNFGNGDKEKTKPTKEQVKKFYAKKPDIKASDKSTWTIEGENVKTQLAKLEEVLKYKPSNKLEIKDLDQKLEVLGVISRFVDGKLRYWVEEIKKDLKG